MNRRLRSSVAKRLLSRRRRLIAEPLEARNLLAAFIVNTINDSGTGSLRDAIVQANADGSADTITFDSGVFSTPKSINLTSALPTITGAVSIAGPGQSLLTIDAGGGTNNVVGDGDGFRIFNIDDGNNANLIDVQISGMTLTGGDTAERGGAIRNLENLTLNDSTVSGNAASDGSSFGGGIYNYVGTLDITNSTISGNTAGFGGGGIISFGSLTVSSSTISGNTAATGGGIASIGTLDITSSTVSGNTAGFYGGGIYNDGSGFATVTSSTISGNSATVADGGGIHNRGASTVTVISSTISGNTAGGDGGGINNVGSSTANPSTVNVTSSTISGNSAGGDGGGINNAGSSTTNPSTVNVTSSTISGNTAGMNGGGINNAGSITKPSTANLTSSTISGNTARSAGGSGYGGGIYNSLSTIVLDNSIVAGNRNFSDGSLDDLISAAVEPTSSHNLIGAGGSGGLTNGTNSNQVGVDWTTVLRNDGTNPILADNGGPTKTIALLNGSPAINAGSSTQSFDQRGPGFPRIVMGQADIGAFELSFPTQGLVVSTATDLNDGDFSAGQLSLREAIALANDNPGADTVTFDPVVFGTPQTISLVQGELLVSSDVTILGPGAGSLTLVAAPNARVMRITDASAAVNNVVLEGLTLTGGNVTSNGGAIEVAENLTLRRSIVRGNQASNGGGISVTSTGNVQITIENSTISGNTATSDGGGVSLSFTGVNTGTVGMVSSTISGNTASGRGGGISAVGNLIGTLRIDDSTIALNNAYFGGGLRTNGLASTELTSSIVATNTASTRPDVSGTINANFNLIGNTIGATLIGANNITGLNPLLAPLADNGGPTPTHALLPGSPAINQGSSTESNDQRGAPFLRNDGGGVDIGAYERQTVAGLSLIVDTISDESDGDYSAGDLSLREAIGLANGSIGPDTITFDAVVFDSARTILLTRQLPTITDAVVITGPGAGVLTIDAGGGIDGTIESGTPDGFRIFEIDDLDAGNQIDVTISGLTLTGGDINVGGAIFSKENLTIERVTLDANRARFGGALTNHRTATITASTFSNNRSTQNGGAIANARELQIFSSTLSGNTALDLGGAILNYAGTGSLGNLTVNRSTLSGNSAGSSGDSIANFPYAGSVAAALNSSIIGDPLAILGGTVTSNFSLFANPNPGVTGSNNLFNADPLLGPLADNGGPTLTHALLPGSPAIDVGFSIEFNDQRGAPFLRNSGGGVDIGAYERQTVASLNLVVDTAADESDGDYSAGDLSLREAIGLANGSIGADTITFSPLFDTAQTINLTSQLPTITDDVTITGPGQSLLKIDAGNGTDNTFATGDGFRIFEINDGNNANLIDVQISGLTLTGGDISGSFGPDPASRGGAIRNLENLTLHDSTISGNAAVGSFGYGGGIYNRGTATVTNSTLSGNSAGFLGGGIFNSGMANMTSSTLSGNSAGVGGGIYNSGTANMTSSTLSGNSADFGGGGIYNNGTATVTSSTLSGNSAGNRGGGIYNRGTATVTSSTLSGNSAGNRGGGIYNVGTANVTSSTLSGNSAGVGGGIYNFGTAHVTSSIVAANNAGTNPDVRGSLSTNTFNLIGANPMLGPLADNGGPTMTHALLPGSPAIDAGSSTATNDQRGAPFVRNVGGGVDIGAFELQTIDFGDAPDPYPTTIANNGASHQAIGPRLGNTRDGEFNGQPTANADGDGSDEDGAMFGSIGLNASMAAVNIDLQNAATAKVDAWIDFNGNDIWEPSEQVLTGRNVTSGIQTLNFTVPASGVVPGTTFARVRVSTLGGLLPTGAALDGEVEDYQVTIFPVVPQVESIIIGDGIDPTRSKVTSVTVKFDSEVDHTALNTAFSVTNITTGTPVGTVSVAATDSAGKTTAVLTFSGASTLAPIDGTLGLGTTLIDGNYRLDIAASQVRLATNNVATMPVDYVFGNQVKADANNDDFFRWYGDDNGDGFTDFTDFANSFLPAFGSEKGVSTLYNEGLDANGDGFVDFNDFADEFLPHFGTARP